MNDPSPIRDNQPADTDRGGKLRQVGTLGTSPAGESFEIVRIPPGQSPQQPSDDQVQRLVLKKLTRARVRSPERFRQQFSALKRLDHPNLCPYRKLFIGEQATRITRDFVDGVPLDEYLLQPITDEESERLAQMTSESETSEQSDASEQSDGDAHPEPSEAEHTGFRTTPDRRDDESPPSTPSHADAEQDRPSTLEIPPSLLEDSEAANRALDLIMLRLHRIVPQLIDALEYLHRFRQVHGNLTPSNVLVTPEGEAILTDYGLHPELCIPSDARRRHACYHAPEVDGGEFFPESDLFSLGAILFEALADRPYGARRKKETADGTDSEFTPVFLSEIVPHCPASWVDLIHALVADDPGERPSLEEVHSQLATTETRSVNIPASVVDDTEPLHGRRDSLQQLIERAQCTSQQRTMNLSVVEGATGVGKTALLDALARECAQRGWVVLHGRCFHREPVAYQGWEKIVDRLTTIADDLPKKPRQRLREGRRRACRLFPQLKPPGEDRPDISRRAAVEGFRKVLRELSEQRPILICFDDIHWAGHDSARLISDLAQIPQQMRLMLVASWRPGADGDPEDHPLWSELHTAPVDVQRIHIEGFSQHEARQYVLAHGANLSLRQKQKVLRRGGLNPLLIDELIHELDEESEPISVGDEQGGGDESSGTDREDVDHYLRSFIVERLDGLTRAERLVLQLLAIASGPLSRQLLTRAIDRELGTHTADVVSGHEVAESLVEKRLARRSRQGVETSGDRPARYVIVHDLCRSVVLDELGRDHHARLCALIADALASQQGDTDDLRFEYLLRAGKGEQAARAAVLAARTAVDRFAYHRATRLWQWLADRDGLDERDRPDFARALLGAGEFREAAEQFDNLLPSSCPRADLRRRRRRIEAFLGAGDRTEALEATGEALRAASIPYVDRSLSQRLAQLPRRIRTAVDRWLDATDAATVHPPDESTDARAELLDFALQTSPFLRSEPTGHLQRHFARIAADTRYGPLLAQDRIWMIGTPWRPFLARDTGSFDRWSQQALQLAERFERPDIRARCLEMGALLARHRGELDTTAERLDDAHRLVKRGDVSDPLLYARVSAHRIDTMLHRGQFDEARRLAERLIHRVRHRRWLMVLARLAACDRELLVGRLDTAERHLETIRDFVGEDRNCLVHIWMMDRRTRLCIARGQPEVAVGEWDLLVDRVYSRKLRRLPPARLLVHRNLGAALAALAERQRTLGEPHLRETLRRLRRQLRRLDDLEPWMNPFEKCRLLRLRARTHLLRRRPSRALQSAKKAETIAADCNGPLVDALNEEAIGFTLAHQDRSEGRERLECARNRWHKLGAYLPLVLEGWPVPDSHARLRSDS